MRGLHALSWTDAVTHKLAAHRRACMGSWLSKGLSPVASSDCMSRDSHERPSAPKGTPPAEGLPLLAWVGLSKALTGGLLEAVGVLGGALVSVGMLLPPHGTSVAFGGLVFTTMASLRLQHQSLLHNLTTSRIYWMCSVHAAQ